MLNHFEKFLSTSIFVLSSLAFAQTKVAIIGGGIAGVSSAHFIEQYDTNAQIILFEKEAQLGGNAQTVAVKNALEQTTFVDAGPQYFSHGPWDDYLAFIEETIGLKNVATESLTGTIVMQKKGLSKPLLVTPLKGNFRGEKIKNLLQLKKFNDEAHSIYKNDEDWRNKTIEDWVNSLQFTDQYKAEIIYPFLGASLGTCESEIKHTSAYEIVSLFAFRKAKASNLFYILKDGMGKLIQQIGEKLASQGVTIKTSAPVYAILRHENKYQIHYTEDNAEKVEEVDFVIMATHAYVGAKLTQQEPSFISLTALLKQFKYFQARIILHGDDRFVNTEKPAFLNIFTDEENRLVSSTMNLSMISPRLNGVYKSWMNEEDALIVKNSTKFYHESIFQHPFITPNFISLLQQLHQSLENHPSLCIVGGWTEGLETQNSAVLSAKRALKVYKNLKNNHL